MRRDLSVTVVRAEDSKMFVRRSNSSDKNTVPRPLRPRVVVCPGPWRLRQKLKVSDRLGAMTHSCPNAVVPGITSSDDNDVFASGINIISVFKFGIQQSCRVELQ